MSEANAILTGRITEGMLRQHHEEFREEIANTIALVEELAKQIFGRSEEEEMSVTDVYTYLLCQKAEIEQLEDRQMAAVALLRLRRAVSVLSITFGVDMPQELLGLDRNVYDTIQAMNIIERNKKDIEQFAAATEAAAKIEAGEEAVH